MALGHTLMQAYLEPNRNSMQKPVEGSIGIGALTNQKRIQLTKFTLYIRRSSFREHIKRKITKK
jgi:hypothetical protein